jgi:hypothetical protein
MLVSNIFSVALLTWLVMPKVTDLLGFWLTAAGDWKKETLGLGTVAFGLVLVVLMFRMLGGLFSRVIAWRA